MASVPWDVTSFSKMSGIALTQTTVKLATELLL
jgi:hypothetical protein